MEDLVILVGLQEVLAAVLLLKEQGLLAPQVKVLLVGMVGLLTDQVVVVEDQALLAVLVHLEVVEMVVRGELVQLTQLQALPLIMLVVVEADVIQEVQ
jgi:hypothetical protein